MRLKTALGLATCVAATAAILSAAPAQAARLPCHLSGSGDSATATCYGGSYTWRLVVDCVDTSNVKWPRVVYTQYGQFQTGSGSQSLSCHGLKANGRLEAR